MPARAARRIESADLANRLAAVVIFSTCLWGLYWLYEGFHTLGDLRGYQSMYLTQGGYLREQSRDPIWVFVISTAATLLGDQNFNLFHFLIYSAWGVMAAWIIWIARAPFFISALILLIVALSKASEQLREATALIFMLVPLVSAMADQKSRPRLIGAASVVAFLTHWGSVVFVVTWIGASIISTFPNRQRIWRRVPFLLPVAAVISAAFVAMLVTDRADYLQFVLTRYSGIYQLAPEAAVYKKLYWVVLGFGVYFIGDQVQRQADVLTKWLYCFVVVLGKFTLPLAYFICAFLIFTNFPFASILELFSRALTSLIWVAMIISLVRGRANWITVAVAVAIFANGYRQLAPFLTPGHLPV
jgi:hypothetical protein